MSQLIRMRQALVYPDNLIYAGFSIPGVKRMLTIFCCPTSTDEIPVYSNSVLAM